MRSSNQAISRSVHHLPSCEDNSLSGTIEGIERSDENVEITLRLDGGTLLIALEKHDIVQNFHVGVRAYALISPLHIIIGL